MSIESALKTAFNALNINQKGVQVATENIANKEVEGYNRRIMEEQTIYTKSGQNLGPEITKIRRIVDQYVVKELQRQTSDLGNIQAVSHCYERLQVIYGSPGSDQSLTHHINQFRTSLQQAASVPESAIYRQQVLQSGNELACKINSLATSLTEVRAEIDRKITEGIDFINQRLDIINNCNEVIGKQGPSKVDSAAMDQRDAAVLQISEYINIKVDTLPNNQLSLRMGGKPLLGFPTVHYLQYTPASSIVSPDMTLTNGQLQPITLSEYSYDCMGDIASGKLAGWIKMRDQEIPNNLQAQLDQLAEVVRDKVNSLSNLGTSYPPPTVLTGNRSFSAGGPTPFAATGLLRLAAINTTDGTFADTLSLDLSTVFTVDDLVTAVNKNSNWTSGTASVVASLNAEQQLVLTAVNTSQGIGMTSLNGTLAQESSTGLGFSHFFGFNDFFTTPGRLAQDGNVAGNVGLSNILSVNATWVNNPNQLPTGQVSSTNPLTFSPLNQNVAVSIGDNSILQQIINAMDDSGQQFSAAGDLPAVADTIVGYTAQIISRSTLKAETVFQEEAYKKELREIVYQKQISISGVSEDEEFIPLIQYKAGYDAAARLVSTIQQMLDTLMAIGR